MQAKIELIMPIEIDFIVNVLFVRHLFFIAPSIFPKFLYTYIINNLTNFASFFKYFL